MEKVPKELLRAFIKENNLVTADDALEAIKGLFSETLQEMLEAELDTDLGYPKNGSVPEGSENRRNGHTTKKVRSSMGELSLTVPACRLRQEGP